MARILVNTKDLSREDWLNYRLNSIGGSEASVILGLNQYKSSFTLCMEKRRLYSEADKDNESMRVGRDLEQYVAERFCEATGKKVKRRNFMFLHDNYDFISANVDREIIGENAGLECKTTNVFAKSDFENGEIPLYYYCQCMHYMAVMGYEKMYLAVLVLGKAFYWFEIERDKEEIDNLISSEIDWWNRYIVNNEEPPIDGSESTSNTIQSIYNKPVDEVVELSEESNIKEYLRLKDFEKEIKVKAENIKNKIQNILGNNERAFTENFKITWKNQNRTTVDSKLLKKEMPDIYEKFTKTTTSRILKITEVK